MMLWKKHITGVVLCILLIGLILFTPPVLAEAAKGNPAQKIRVACVGNSVTRGYGLKDADRESYPSQLQELLGDAYDVRNFGHSGATLLEKGHNPYIQTPEFREALAYDADIIVIHLGLNDTDPRNWPNYRDEFITDYIRLVQLFHADREDPARVFICRMSPIFHGHPRFESGTRDWFRQIQHAIVQVAEHCNTQLIDLHAPLYNRPDLFKDALHPDAEGAGIIARTVYESITGNHGGLDLAGVFMDHMVFQKGVAHPVWGKANAGDTVTAVFSGEVKNAVADGFGNWRLTFEPAEPGGPYRLEVTTGTDNSVVIEDILVGEVWICAGQSNMEFQLRQADQSASVIAKAPDNDMRLLNLQGIVRPDHVAWDLESLDRLNRLDYFQGEWVRSNVAEASAFSAIGYAFGEMIHQELDVPVGLINISVGGAPAEAFIDRSSLEEDPWMVNVLKNWMQNDFIMAWCRERAAKNLEAGINPLQRHPFEPSYIYEAGVKPLEGFPVAGVIWYQGESNAHNAEHYLHAFPLLVKSWRKAFNNPRLPFYFAQLSSISRPSWPYFRDIQRRLSHAVPYTGMVVTSDLGDSLDVHPTRKTEVGKRFAMVALSDTYKADGMSVRTPQVKYAGINNGKVTVTFTDDFPLTTSDGLPVKEVEIAGSDGVFLHVEGTIDGNSLIVDTGISGVSQIRYGWKPFSRGNLIQSSGMPVPTFLIDIPYMNSE